MGGAAAQALGVCGGCRGRVRASGDLRACARPQLVHVTVGGGLSLVEGPSQALPLGGRARSRPPVAGWASRSLGSVSGNSAAPPGGAQAPDGEQGSQWRPCPAREGSSLRPEWGQAGRRSRTCCAVGSRFLWAPPPQEGRHVGRPRPPVGAAPSVSPLGGRLTPRGGVGAGAAGLRALGRVWVLFVGLSWPHVQSTGRAREVFAVAVSATPAVLMLPISA